MKPRPSEMPALALPTSGEYRAAAGVIVTAREQVTDDRLVVHCAGRNGLAQVCAELDDRDGDWRVLSISTPVTIFRDLQGTRASELYDETRFPEPQMLARVGRLDLLDPSLVTA